MKAVIKDGRVVLDEARPLDYDVVLNGLFKVLGAVDGLLRKETDPKKKSEITKGRALLRTGLKVIEKAQRD